MTDMACFRLWQLISPALPVGAYAYSGGLEAAVEAGHVDDFDACVDWLGGLLAVSFTYVDLPIFDRLHAAWSARDLAAADHWTRTIQAMRESSELLAEDRHMGGALQRLLQDLGVSAAREVERPSFATMYALACVHWHVEREDGARGLIWSWLENQVAAAVKLVPFGQTDGQRMIGVLIPIADAAVQRGLALEDDELGRSLPGLGVLSALHEHQYSRLFRS